MKKIKEFVESYYLNEHRSPSTAEIAKNLGVVKEAVKSKSNDFRLHGKH